MAQSREQQILGALLQDRTLIKKCGISKSFFKTERQRAIFNELQNGAADVTVITQRIKEKFEKFDDVFTYISDCLEGVHRMTPAGLQQMVNDVRKGRLNLEIENELKKTIVDHDKIRDLYFKIDNLEISSDGNNWIKLETIEPTVLNWLWWNRIPFGSYSSICGDPGDGKSIVLTDICAKITKGEKLPDRQGVDPKGSIIYFVAEDNLSDTVRIRAEDAGADLKKFFVTTGEKSSSGFFSIVDPEDRQSLENQIKKLKDVKAVVFDPISTFMSGLRTNDENEVRAALAPLNRMAEKYQLAIIGVSHLNKDQAKRALYRLSGSIAFVAVARTVWLVKKDEDSDRRFFAPLKFNILKDPTTLAFKISGDIGRPRVEFEDLPVDITPDELLGDADIQARLSAVSDAKIFLSELLTPGEPMAQKEIADAAKVDGHSFSTLKRAKKQMGILSEKRIDGWYWRRS